MPTQIPVRKEKRMKRNSKRRAKSKRAKRVVTPGPPRYSTLTAHEKEEHGRSIDLLYDLRHGEGTYTKLLRKHRLSARKARRYLGPNLLGGTRGKRVRPSKTDRLVRELWFPRSVGDVPIRTRSSRDATNLSDYYNDREKLLRGKLSAGAFEAKWRGVRIAGEEVFADAAAILEMADADILNLENLYSSVGPER